MWILLVGPFLSLLPARWRKAIPFHDAVHWKSASILSGMAESFLAVVGLLYWYSYSVITWVSKGLDAALSKSAPTGLTDHEVGFAALIIWATHPLTWVLFYVVIEGAVRLCASFTDTVVATLPLYLTEKIYSKIRGIKDPLPLGAPKFEQSNVASYMSTMHDKITTSRLPQVPDELFTDSEESDEWLEIRSCRAKDQWDPPRVVRYQDRYYRLEQFRKASSPRPFLYRLRRLSAGVPGRAVLVYSPELEPVVANR